MTARIVEKGRVSKVLAFRGLERTPVDIAEAGDIVAIAGLETSTVADTLADPVGQRAAAVQADRSADAVGDVPHQ